MAIVSISSHVARGYIGATAAGFALRRLGHDVWEVPTVVWNHHPGHGRPAGPAIAADDIAAMLAPFARSPWRDEVELVMTGYFVDAEQVRAAATFVSVLRASGHNFLYLCDPVMGDAGGTYVHRTVIDAIRADLLPLADIATPNRFELALIAADPASIATNAAIVHAARALGIDRVAVTSAHPRTLGIANLLVGRSSVVLHETRAFANPPHGTGDLFAGVLAAKSLVTPPREALIHAGNVVCRVVEATALKGRDELDLAAWNDLIEHPPHTGNVVHIAATDA